jgi:hypothetical protein
VTGYVKSIDPNTKEVRIVETMKGTDYIDLTAYKATEQAKVYLPGALASGFTSLKKQLLPASLGGSDTFFGVDKADATILNANRYDGSSMTSTNFLDKLFEFYLDTLYVGKMGNANEALMNLKHLGKIIPKLEGSRRFAVADKSAGYGFRKVTLIGPEGGEFTITGVRDMPTDLIYMLDWNTIKVFSDQFIERIKNPDGLEYYTERVAGANGGYRHICDHRLYAEAAVLKPSANGVIYGVQA